MSLSKRIGAALGCAALWAAFAAAPASAGTQVVTGEDEHCSGTPTSPSVCDYTRKIIEYARGGAPDPSKPILLLACDNDATFIESAYDPDPTITIVCPGSTEYDATVFSTDSFSAILVGESEAANDALNAREADFQGFFDSGGGIVTFDSADDDSDLDFLPLDPTLDESNSPSDPYFVTAEGAAAIGITDDEANDDCCQHEAYAEPEPGSLLKVGVRDDSGLPMLLFARTDRPSPVTDAEKPQPQPQPEPQPAPPPPAPLSQLVLDPSAGTGSVGTRGLFVVPGMQMTCIVGPCPVYERAYDIGGARAASGRPGRIAVDRDMLGSSQTNAARMRLTKNAARKLRRRGSMRLEALVTLTDALGRSQTVRKKFTLRARRPR